MRLHDPNNTGPLDRLLNSLTKAISGGTNISTQSSPISTQTMRDVFGTGDEFLSRYRNFEEEYFRLLQDPKNRAKYAVVRDMATERSRGVLDLSRFTYKVQEELKDMFRRNVLQMEHLLPQAGFPSLEYPSGNFYSSLLQFDVESNDHPATTLLRRMFFNVQSNKNGIEALNFGTANMLSADSLQRATRTQDFNPGLGKKILTLDVETTDVLNDAQVRQFAYQMETVGGEVGELNVRSFINERMNIAKVTRSGMSTKMSIAAAGAAGEEMGPGGANFFKAADELFTQMLNADHISGHNLMFDITKLDTTLESLGAYQSNAQLLQKRNQVFTRISQTSDYFIDTAETMRSYLTGLASSKYGINDPNRALSMVDELLSPEFKSISKSAPISMENISLNTNLFNLIEQEAASGSNEAIEIMAKISQGSHVADVDVALQASADRYRREKKLDFRFDPTTDQPINAPLTDFEKYARNKIFKSQAMTPTTNIASVQLLSDASFNYLTSQDEGMQGVQVVASRRDLNLAGDLDSEGILKYDRAKNAYSFRAFGDAADEEISASTAKTYITRTLNQARALGEGSKEQIIVGNKNLQITRNRYDERILSTGFNYMQDTAVVQGLMGQAATAGVTAEAGDDMLIRSLGLTSEQFGAPKSFGGIMSRIRQGFSGSQISNIVNPLESSDETIRSYHANAARAGLPFNSLNVQNRVFSVGLAEATHSIGLSAKGTATYAANADLTAELGLSYFKMQANRTIGSIDASGDLVTPSRVRTPFAELFDISENTSANRISDQTLSVKAFGSTSGPGADIMATDLNRFTMSFVSGSGESGSTMASRVNLVWGANQAFDEGQSKQLATFMLDNVNQFLDTVDSIKSTDANLAKEIQELQLFKSSSAIVSDTEKLKVTTRLAEFIRERGIVVGYVEGDAAEGIRDAAIRQGADITGNDRFFANMMMRIGFADKESGILVMSAISDVTADEVIGRTSEVAQRETAEAVNGLRRLSTIFEDASKRRQARRAIMEARDSSSMDRVIDLSRRAARDFSTPMTDFYLKNKKSIGFAGIGLAAAGIGYYMYNKSKEQKVYNESVEPMPPEPASSETRRQMEPMPLAKSTRRDPLVTAGVVGNLDRNKIGHSKMGPNKYNHLYGG